LGVLASELTPPNIHRDWAIIVAAWGICGVIGLPVTLVVQAIPFGWLALPSLWAVPIVVAPVLVILVTSLRASIHNVQVVMGVDHVNGFYDHFSEGHRSWGLEHVSSDVEGESSEEQSLD
jgi:hypothetical protein